MSPNIELTLKCFMRGLHAAILVTRLDRKGTAPLLLNGKMLRATLYIPFSATNFSG
jgi:hypothetical protein